MRVSTGFVPAVIRVVWEEKKTKRIPSRGIEPRTYRFETVQLQPSVISIYTTRGFDWLLRAIR